jgi:flagellin-like hook-associated protein FlgL
MNITGIGSRSSLVVRSLLDLRSQLDDLQRQLGTGRKANDYAGVGVQRGFAVGLRSHVNAIDSYQDSILNVVNRVQIAQTTLGRMNDIKATIKSASQQASALQQDGTTVAQSTAYMELNEMLSLLNTRADQRYLFSGLGIDQPAVETFDHVMNGDGARAGVTQLVTERRQADLGASGLGRLALTTLTPTSFSVDEDAVSPFGFKLDGISTTLTGAVLTGPAGAPASLSIDLTANPSVGEKIEITFDLPDGTSETITLIAVTSAIPGSDTFTIGATPDVTAANLMATLTASISKLADTSLTAASAVAASRDFFSNPPQRVVGPPFDSATAQVAGTAADTVIWYTGEDGPVPARATATARIDAELTVSYGMRANEPGLLDLMQNIAALAVVTYSSSDPNAADRAAALGVRVGANLTASVGAQSLEGIQVDLANGQALMESAADRHRQTKAALSDLLQGIEGVQAEEVAAQVLALQTRLQASLQTTSMLYQISLVNYL